MEGIYTQRAEGFRVIAHEEEKGLKTLVLLGRSDDDAPVETIGQYEMDAPLWDALAERREEFVPATV